MPRQPETRRKILDRAQTLLQERGYNGFSYRDISSQLNIKNAAIHYYFPTKEDLGAEIVRTERRRFNKCINLKRVQEQNAWGKLETYFAIYTDYMDHGNRMCIPGSLAPQITELSPEFRDETQGLVADMLSWVEAILKEGRADGSFAFEGSVHDKATLVMGAIQGALQMARISGRQSLEHAIAQIRKDLTP